MRLIDADKAYEVITDYYHHNTEIQHIALKDALSKVPSVEEESFEWCADCKEYDQEAHCCHRWRKVIRETLAEIREEIRNEMG